MAKKREVSFFTDIQSDEDFDKFLEQNQLLILDIYQDLFGSCVSLQYSMVQKKISLEDTDSVQLATCNADKIERLKRFRGKSQPTIVFCRHKKVIDVLYGPFIPPIDPTIQKYVEICTDVAKYSQLETYDFDEPLPFEAIEIEKIQKIEQERIRAENEAEHLRKFSELDNIIDIMNANVSDMGVTMFMPHIGNKGLMKTFEVAKRLYLVNRGEKTIQLTPDMMEVLNYKVTNPIPEKILEHIYEKDISLALWYTDPRNPITSVLEEFQKIVSEPQERYTEDDERVFETILESFIIDLNEADEQSEDSHSHEATSITSYLSEVPESSTPQETQPPPDEDENLRRSSMRASQTTERGSEIGTDEVATETPRGSEIDEDENLSIQSDDTKIVIPPIWTPRNQEGNAIFMYVFFRKQFDSFLPPVIEPEPPHLCVMFPAKIRHQILELCDEHPSALLNYGFFDGEDFDDFNMICKNVECFDNLSTSGNEKMILKVSKKTSLLALDLMKLNPLYVSQNIVDGQEECARLFIEEEEKEEEGEREEEEEGTEELT